MNNHSRCHYETTKLAGFRNFVPSLSICSLLHRFSRTVRTTTSWLHIDLLMSLLLNPHLLSDPVFAVDPPPCLPAPRTPPLGDTKGQGECERWSSEPYERQVDFKIRVGCHGGLPVYPRPCTDSFTFGLPSSFLGVVKSFSLWTQRKTELLHHIPRGPQKPGPVSVRNSQDVRSFLKERRDLRPVILDDPI